MFKELESIPAAIFVQVSFHFIVGLSLTIVTELGCDEVERRIIQRGHAVQRCLHKISNQQIVKDLVLDCLHQATSRHFKGDAPLLGPVQGDPVVTLTNAEIDEPIVRMQSLLSYKVL